MSDLGHGAPGRDRPGEDASTTGETDATSASGTTPSTASSVMRGAGEFYGDAVASTVIAYLITGPAMMGGLGWLVDRWLGTSFVVGVGIIAGMIMSVYVIWVRYGRP
ncbi:MAG: hypothetical protein V9F04_06910 [Dermatophilaceae bacterium]